MKAETQLDAGQCLTIQPLRPGELAVSVQARGCHPQYRGRILIHASKTFNLTSIPETANVWQR